MEKFLKEDALLLYLGIFMSRFVSNRMNSTNTTLIELRGSDYPLIIGQPIILFITIFTMLLMFLFRNKNPLKSRGFLPYLSMTVFFMFSFRIFFRMMSIFDGDIPKSITSTFTCYWFIIPQSPLLANVFIILSLNMLRFILNNFLVKKQNEIWEIKDGVHEMKRRGSSENIPGLEEIEAKTTKTTKRIGVLIKFIKVVLSGWVSTAVSIIYFIFWVIIEVIILVIGEKVTGTTCLMGTSKNVLNFMMGGSIIMFSFVFILATIVFIVDIVLHLVSHLGCDCTEYIKEDPLFFRLEFLLTYFPFFILFIALTMQSFVTQTFLNEWVPKVGIFVVQLILLYLFGGNLLLITIIKTIKDSRKAIDPSDLMEVLGDKKGKDLFSSFSKKEWSQENVLLYNEILKYKELTTKQKTKRALDIYSTYISSSALIEVNLPSEVTTELNGRISTYKEDEEDLWSKLFDTVELEVIKNMKDTFLRFTNSTDYKEWVKSLRK